MSIFSGPEIITDGLVLYYDMNNLTRSWKGATTTNQHTNTNTFSDWTLNVATIDTIDNVSRLTETGTTGGPFMYQNTSITNGVVYTESIYAKADLRYVLQITPSTGFSNNTLYTNFNLVDGTMTGTGTAKSTITDEGNGWYRCTYTETASATTSGRMVYGIAISPESTRLDSVARTDGYGIFVKQSQLEAKSFASPYVDGTRSNTQVLLDLSGVNVITADSLTYNSNNTFSFDGTTNSITIPNNITYSGGFTLSAWINPVNAGENTFGRIFDKTTTTGSTSGFFLLMNNNPLVQVVVNNATTINSTANSVPYNSWTNVTATVSDTGSTVLYINGQSNATGTTGAPSGITTSNLLTIGNRSGTSDRTFNGSIPTALIYSRALTATEVKQNYLATKGRYGL